MQTAQVHELHTVIPPDHPAVRERLLRPAAIVGLLGVALIHFLDVFDKFKETPYLGVAYVILIAGCVAASWLLLKHDARPGWTVALIASAGTLAGFILSRTTGLPGAHGDVGNWSEPLGLASLFVEALLVFMSVYALFLHPPKRR